MNYDEMTRHLFSEFNARCLWSEQGPKDTRVERIEAFACKGRVVITQKYLDGGWEIFVPVSDSLNPQTNLSELKNRLSDEPHEIVVTMEGGLIQHIDNIPHNVHVKIMDFDIEGTTNDLKENALGELYVESIHVGGQLDDTVEFKLTKGEQ